MPSLISGRVQVTSQANLQDSRFDFLNLTQAQPSLGKTPSTTTGFTLVSTPTGVVYANSLGNLVFSSGTVTSNIPNGNITLLTTGTATVRLQSNLVSVSNAMTFTSTTSYIALGGRNSVRIPNYYEGTNPPTNVRLWEGDQWYDPVADVLYEYNLNTSSNYSAWIDITGPFFSTAAYNPPGTESYTGSQGYTGSRGYLGSTGFTGSRGYTGSAGTNGFVGSQGVDGLPGERGFTGSQAYTGSRGYTGSASTAVGPEGPIGFTGSQGEPGPAGGQGFTGSRGNNGLPGINGYTGSRGDTGTVTVSNNLQISSLGVGTAAPPAGEIRATGNITGNFTSDLRLKENVRDITGALDKVAAIGGKLFDWTDTYISSHGGIDDYFLSKSDFGVVAQDVQLVFPQAVRTRADGYLAVDYVKLCALAFAAIKELKQEIDQLKGLK